MGSWVAPKASRQPVAVVAVVMMVSLCLNGSGTNHRCDLFSVFVNISVTIAVLLVILLCIIFHLRPSMAAMGRCGTP